MKILLVSTLKRKVTAAETASRSRIIFELAKGLAEKGHTISLLGTGDSDIPGVTVIPVIEKSWVDTPYVENPYFYETSSLVRLARKIVEIQNNFDIIHSHVYPDFFIPLVENELTTPLLTTIHIQATDYIDETFSLFKKTHFVSISNAHKSGFKKTKINAVIYNGIDTNLYSFQPQKQDYSLWIGRLSKSKNDKGNYIDPKGIEHAIQLAQKTNEKLLLSGNVEDMQFFNTKVKPFLNNKIQWIGKISPEQSLSKQEVVKLMQGAKAFLMTINWEEPFGLVMAEAMSCGTPVIAFNRGSVSEIVEDGKTGFVVDPDNGINGLKLALSQIQNIKPKDCRDHVLKHFSLEKMIKNYENEYQQIRYLRDNL